MPERRSVESSDGTMIAYTIHGKQDAPWLVLSNGAGCSDEFWTTALIPALENRFHILEWRYRGHYDSGPPSDPMRYRIEDHAADLNAILADAGIREAVFLGFSFGVQVTLEARRRRPEAFRALVFVSGSYEDPLATFAGIPALRPLIAALLEFGARHPRLTEWVVRFAVGGPITVPFAKIARFCEADVPDGPFCEYLRRASRLNPIAYMWTLRLMGDHSARDVLSSIDVPTLLIAGLEDAMTPVSVMERMRDEIPGAEYLPVASGRHTMLMTRGAWIAERIADFVDRRL